MEVTTTTGGMAVVVGVPETMGMGVGRKMTTTTMLLERAVVIMGWMRVKKPRSLMEIGFK